MTVLAARLAAGLAAAGIGLFAAWGVVFILLVGTISAQAPDPLVPDGDPCCGHPDTWGEVAVGVAWTLGYVVLDALLVCLAVALLTWAIKRRWPPVKRLAIVPAGAVVAAVLVLAVVIVPIAGSG